MPTNEVVEECYDRIGFVMRRERERLKLSQQALADQLGWSRGTIVNIESSRQRVMLHDLPKLAKVLRTPIYDFFPPEWGCGG